MENSNGWGTVVLVISLSLLFTTTHCYAMNEFSKLDRPEVLSAIFYPDKCAKTPLPENAVDLDIEVDEGITIGGRFFIHDKASPTILFFHGNGELVAHYDEIGPMYTATGMNFLVVDYRGYGWSGGSPTVAAMLADAEVIFHEVRSYLASNDFSGAFFLMGRSLGSVSAIDLAKNHGDDIKGLILESAIADTIPLANNIGLDFGPVDFSEEDGFRNLAKIEKVTKPTFIFHGAMDQLIQPAEAEKLQSFSGARTKEFVVIPGADHNSLIAVGGRLYFETSKNFINKLTGATNWRKQRKQGKSNREAI